MPASIFSRVVVTNADGDEVSRDEGSAAINDPVGANGVRQIVTLAIGFVALTVPTGATLCQLSWTSGTGSLTLKGITTDTGVALGVLDATTPRVTLPVSSPSVGITSTAVGELEVIWL